MREEDFSTEGLYYEIVRSVICEKGKSSIIIWVDTLDCVACDLVKNGKIIHIA